MKIHRLTIKSFMAIDEANLAMNDKGLVLIQGVNADDPSTVSNGAGKSSIPDALSWCLFGSTARGVTGDAVVNRHAKHAFVEIVLDDNGHTYRITRTRKHPKHKNRLQVHEYGEIDTPVGPTMDWADLTKGTDKETQDLVNKIIGCDLQVFNAAVYQGQERMPDLPNYTDKQLKELVEEAAGITVLQDCYALARAAMRETEVKVEAWVGNVTSRERDVERLEFQVETLNRQTDEWEIAHKTKVEAATGRLADQERLLKELEAKWETASEKLPAIEAKIEALQKSLKAREEYTAALAVLEGTAKQANDHVVRCQANHSHAQGQKNAREIELKNAAARVGSPCGECGKEILSEDLTSVIEALQLKLDEADAARLKASDELRKAQDAHNAAKKDVADYKATMPDFTETAEKLGELKTIKAKIDNLGNSVNTETDRFVVLRDDLKAIKAETSPYVAMIEKAKTELKDEKINLKAARKNLENHQADLDKHEKVVEVFSPAGVRAHILDHVTPFLNSRTAHYLSILSDANLQAEWSTLSKTAKGELREKFCIDVRNATGGDQFGLLSGGEKRKVRLACAMALQDVVSGRALKPIDLFMADEIDDALDEAGLERLMSILDEKARERGTVLVISHRSLSDWIREVCLVTKEKGKSRITGALSV